MARLSDLSRPILTTLSPGWPRDAVEQLLDFAALGEVAAGEAHRLGLRAEFLQPVRIGILVDAVKAGPVAALEFERDDLVGQQHEFLDELVRDVVLGFLEMRGDAEVVDAHFHLGEIEIERALGEAAFAQHLRHGVERVEMLAERRRRPACCSSAKASL